MFSALSSRTSCAICLFAVLAVLAGAAPATTLTWTNQTGDGYYATDGNWSDGYKPTPTDMAHWLAVGGETVFTADESASGAQVQNTVTWTLNGYDYGLSGSVLVGFDGIDGNLTIANGTGHSSALAVGVLGPPMTTGADGALTLSNCDWGMNTLAVALEGNGELLLTSTSNMETYAPIILARGVGTTGTITLEGGSHWDHFTALQLGGRGTGIIDVSGSSKIETIGGHHVELAYGADSTVEMGIDGPGSSLISSGDIYVGKAGQATLTISSGASATGGMLATAYDLDSTGNLTVTGAGSLASGVGGVSIAEQGTSTVNVTDGAMLLAGEDGGSWQDHELAMAETPESVAEVTVSGVDSRMLSGGELHIAREGTTTLTVSSGALVESGQCDSRQVVIAEMDTSEAQIAVTGTGSQLNATEGLDIARGGNATVVVSEGGQMTSGWQDGASWQNSDTTIAGAVDSSADVTVTGANSKLISGGDIAIGGDGQAVLTVSSGGRVLAIDDNARLSVAQGMNARASVNVTGAESLLATAGELILAEDGEAEVVVSDGALLASGRIGPEAWTNKRTAIAATQDSYANVTVTGAGSSLVSGGQMMIAEEGSALLQIAEGGRVRINGTGWMAMGTDGSADVSVRGIGSELSASGAMAVGEHGQVNLAITDGGLLAAGMHDDGNWNASNIVIANQTGSSSSVEVSGPKARMLAGGHIHVGGSGNASLAVSAGGKVQAGAGGDTNAEFTLQTPNETPAALTVDGEGSQVSSCGHVYLARAGQANVSVTEGAQILAGIDEFGEWMDGQLRIADDTNTIADLNISGAGSRVGAGGNVEIASNGRAEIGISDGAKLLSGLCGEMFGDGMVFARNSSSSANVVVDGLGSEIIATGQLTLAGSGSMELGLYNGARVATEADIHGNCRLGAAIHSDGELYIEIAGIGSTLQSHGMLTLGGEGVANVVVSGGGSIVSEGGPEPSNQDINISEGPSAHTTILLDGAGTEMSAGEIYVGGNEHSVGGPAEVNIRNGAYVEASTALQIRKGLVSMDSALMETSELRLEEYGNLEVRSSSIRVGGSVNNDGTITLADGGRIRTKCGPVNNTGLIKGSGVIGGSFNNQTDGICRVAGMDYMRFAAPGAVNEGELQLIGGVMDFAGEMRNCDGGVISGRGGIIVEDILTNEGSVLLGGDTDIYGQFVNGEWGTLSALYGEVVVSAGASVAFYDPVVHNGVKFKVSPNADVAFFGLVTGEGGFTGGGGVWFEGGYSPGNSPAYIQMGVDITYGSESSNTMEIDGYISTGPSEAQYDVLEMICGSFLTLDGSLEIALLGGFEPVFGSQFDIYRYDSGNRTGEFADFTSPIWGDGLHFDIDYGETAVTVTVVPEPLTVSLLLLGGGLIGLRRRRV